MTNVKRYLTILLVACFSVAATGTAAMAHCDHSVQGHETPGIEKKMDGCSHSHAVEEKKHNSFDDSRSAEDNANDHSDTEAKDAEHTS